MQIFKDSSLPPNQYVPMAHHKTLIVLHHTVGGTATSTIRYWAGNPEKIGTAFVIDRDGTIHQAFEPEFWASHLGIKDTPVEIEQRSIGIELCNWGPLCGADDELYFLGKVSDATLFRGTSIRKESWRGYDCFETYAVPQLKSTQALVIYLLDKFGIAKQVPKNRLNYDKKLYSFQGVLSHFHLRADKSDVHPGFDWDELIKSCSLTEQP